MVHVDAELAPTTADAHPAAQSWQEALLLAPSASEYVPLQHGVQEGLPAKLKVPTGHMLHVVFSIAPTAEEAVPAGHKVQVAVPLASE
jgi:hypothetical protein